MAYYGRSKRLRRGKWENRMAIIGITMVVISLAVAVNAKGASLKAGRPGLQTEGSGFGPSGPG